MMGNNLDSHFEELEAIRDGDIEIIEFRERRATDQVYFELKQEKREKEERKQDYNRLKDISDRREINPYNIFSHTESKRNLLIGVMGYRRFDNSSDAMVGKVFLNCYNSAK